MPQLSTEAWSETFYSRHFQLSGAQDITATLFTIKDRRKTGVFIPSWMSESEPHVSSSFARISSKPNKRWNNFTLKNCLMSWGHFHFNDKHSKRRKQFANCLFIENDSSFIQGESKFFINRDFPGWFVRAKTHEECHTNTEVPIYVKL